MTRLRTFGPKKGERFYIIVTSGWTISTKYGHGKYGTSFSVIDSAFGKEVATFTPETHGSSNAQRKHRAEMLCARMNADERDWERNEGKYAPPPPINPMSVEGRRAQTHCRRGGHPLSGDNLYLRDGKRHCKTCRAEYAFIRQEARKAVRRQAERLGVL